MSTTLIALRHGKPLSEGYADETLRPLSDEGKEATKSVVQTILACMMKPTTLYSSPLPRAMQTAEVVANRFRLKVRSEESLGYDFDGEKLLKLLPPPKENQTIVFVGHMPSLKDFVNDLFGEVAIVKIAKSQGIAVEFKDEIAFGQGRLITILSP